MFKDMQISGSGPRNIQFFLDRLTAFSKNTIAIQPQTKTEYRPHDTISFRMPASALLDLHTLTLRFRMTFTQNTDANTAANLVAGPPRYLAPLFRRIDGELPPALFLHLVIALPSCLQSQWGRPMLASLDFMTTVGLHLLSSCSLLWVLKFCGCRCSVYFADAPHAPGL